MDGKEKARSWFCVWNNPQIEYPDNTPDQIAEAVLESWVSGNPTRTGAVAYCISADGLIHLHMVLEDSSQARFSALKKAYPKAHLEPTKGTKEQAEDYIHKRGKFAEKGEEVVYIAKFGEIKGAQGQRKDFEVIQDWLDQGMTPSDIMYQNIRYRKYEKYIKDHFFEKRKRETPPLRDVDVYWHVGDSGSGKTYTYVQYCEKFGEDYVYLMSDYQGGGLDDYCGEKYLFMDEYRGQLPYSTLLKMLQGYKHKLHARFTNALSLWSEVHITSIFPPELVYKKMVTENREIDTQTQLFRRIKYVVYHWKDDSGFHQFILPMSEYIDLEDLKHKAMGNSISDFVKWDGQESLPFN